MFQAQFAYSVEVWNGDNLVGGLYGVCLGNFVSGESMFTKEDNASKFALYSLVKHLASKKIQWLDTQMVTSVVESFGGHQVPRSDFLKMLQTVNWDLTRDSLFGT